MIAVVDYGRGNLFSLSQALRHLGAEHDVTEDPAHVALATQIILPGVGAFSDAMDRLAKRNLVAVLREAASRGVPFLGICLGMQLLTDASEEFGSRDGLSLIPGTVRQLPSGDGGQDSTRIPNVGWRRLELRANHPVLEGLEPGAVVYFDHSYAPAVDDPAHLGAVITVNGAVIAAVIARDNVVGFQFHPEKSGPAGLDLLQRFLVFRPSEPPRPLPRSP